jgi:DNA (cytosine-5)-methyltransferase 1
MGCLGKRPRCSVRERRTGLWFHLGALVELGYGFAYRVLDAQHFGVPQRRRRVFVVGCLGDAASAVQILFEPEGLCGDLATSRKTGKKASLIAGDGAGSGITQSLTTSVGGADLVHAQAGLLIADTITTGVARYQIEAEHLTPQYTAPQFDRVRRLTPRECERLQGFPDDYTLVPYRGKPAADSPRYRALGNSMAVPVMRWLGQRIELQSGSLGLPSTSCKAPSIRSHP